MSISTAVQTGLGEVARWTRRNSPSILTALGVSGLVTTTILAVTATPKAIRLIEEEKMLRAKANGNGEPKPLSKTDVIKVAWKPFVPVAISLVASGTCIIMANSISYRRNVALASAATLIETTYKQYQAEVIEQFGKNKATKIVDGIAEKELANNPVQDRTMIVTGKGKILFFDSLSARYFESDTEFVKQTINTFNEQLLNRDRYKTLNEFYADLGLEGTAIGTDIGWDTDHGLLEVLFTTKMASNDVPCAVMNYNNGPHPI